MLSPPLLPHHWPTMKRMITGPVQQGSERKAVGCLSQCLPSSRKSCVCSQKYNPHVSANMTIAHCGGITSVVACNLLILACIGRCSHCPSFQHLQTCQYRLERSPLDMRAQSTQAYIGAP